MCIVLISRSLLFFVCSIADCFNLFSALLDWATGSELPAELSRELVAPTLNAFESSGSLPQRISANLLYQHSRVLLGEYSGRRSATATAAAGVGVEKPDSGPDSDSRRLVRRPLPECARDARQWQQPAATPADGVLARHIHKRFAHSSEHSHELRLDWKRVPRELALRIAHFIQTPYASFAESLRELYSPGDTRANELRYEYNNYITECRVAGLVIIAYS